jgi:chemotaxis protein methyltransferase CheR
MERQKEVIGKFYRCLVDGGLLIVSPAETSAPLFSPFVSERFEEATLYRKEPERKATPERPMPYQPEFLPCTAAAPAMITAPVSWSIPFADEAPPVIEAKEELEDVTPRALNLYDEALALFERGRLAETEQKIAALLALPGNHAPALALLARVRADTGKLAEARDLCERAIAGDKLNPGYHYLQAIIQQELGFLDESIASLKRAIYLDQNFVLAHFSLGNLALRQGKVREADRHLKNALAALTTLGKDDILPESEGLTAGRMVEIIRTTTEEVLVS